MSSGGYIVTHLTIQAALITKSYTMVASGAYVLLKLWRRISRINIALFVLYPQQVCAISSQQDKTFH